MRLRIAKGAFALSYTLTVILMGGSPTLAGDPFRTSNTRDIDSNTQAAFEALYREGDYEAAKRYLSAAEKSEVNEPLAYAMQATLGYLNEDWETLKDYADKTLQAAQTLSSQDPLRSNLYLAVGHFLEGTYNFKTKEDTSDTVSKLQKVLYYFDAAEANATNDPELNLLKGYLELILADNLPFSNPENAIEQLEKQAAPPYLVNRGMAVAYLELNQYDKALEFIEQALAATPENPELAYLKGHILRQQSLLVEDKAELALLKRALTYYELALVKAAQLPKSVRQPIEQEHRQTQEQINQLTPLPTDEN